MAIPVTGGITFTPAEQATIIGAYQSVIAIYESKVNYNMTNEERGDLSTVGDGRAVYVMKSIGDYATQYPLLNGAAYPLALAQSDLDTYGFIENVHTMDERAGELSKEIQLVAGHFAFKFMRDQFHNAERYRGDNVPGAQVVYDGLKGCFEGQGPQNTPPATP